MFAYCVPLRQVAAAAVLASCLCAPASAQESAFSLPFVGAIDEALAGRIETSSGVDATASSLSTYWTSVIAPLGPLHQDGLRLKLYGSYGSWSYDRRSVFCALSPEEMKKLAGADLSATCNSIANRVLTPQERNAIETAAAPFGLHLEGDQLYFQEDHRVTRYDGAVMPGWQMSWAGFALKAYAGPAMEVRQSTSAEDEALSGTYWGAKTAVESWMALGEQLWMTADGTYFTGTTAYTAALRLGWQAAPWLTLGPEAAAFGDADDDSTRAGGFLRFTIGGTEATLSGGISADYGGATSPYGQAGVYMKF